MRFMFAIGTFIILSFISWVIGTVLIGSLNNIVGGVVTVIGVVCSGYIAVSYLRGEVALPVIGNIYRRRR